MTTEHFVPGPASSPRAPRWKRAIDLAASIAALPLLPMLFMFLFVVTRLTSPGPVIFRQQRIGFRGQAFDILKFRTMHVSSDTSSHEQHIDHLFSGNAPMVKLDNHGDTRLIPFGRHLRATGLDELPQLINVLRGEMSVVGPRPCLPYEYHKYTRHYIERFTTPPGLTGLWQVSGKNHTTFAEMMRLDMQYVKARSIRLDLYIILKTPFALVRQVIETRMIKLNRAKSLSAPPKQSPT